jgi:hypothetical protein
MKRIATFACLVALFASACTTVKVPAEASSSTRQQHEFLALREFGVRTAPSLEADEIQRVAVGTAFTAEADLAPNLDWRWIHIVGGTTGYVFGMPFRVAK